MTSLISALAALGASYTVNIALAYADDGSTVTATIFVKPKESTKGLKERHLQLAGTPADVEKQIAEQLPAAVNQIVDHAASLTAQLEKQSAADAAEEAAEQAKEAAKPKPVVAGKKPAPKAAVKPVVVKPVVAKPAPAAATKTEPAKAEPAPTGKPVFAVAKAVPTADGNATRPPTAAEQAVLSLLAPADTDGDGAL